MNKLVEYLEKHHNPGGNAIKHVRIGTLLEETEWTISEIFNMAYDARESQYLTLSMKTGHRVGDNDPEGLESIGVWNELYRKMRKKAEFRG